MRTVRWGFLATGKVARTVAADLALVPGSELVAVGARRLESARAFVDAHAPSARAHASYAALVADPEVDVVYIASPHALHLEHARMAFEAGKHVLCEKPVTLDLADAQEMVRLAGRHDRFLMEAMWTACHPVVVELADRVRSGELGTPRTLRAELGFRVDAAPDDRLLDPALGASALLDMGIYPLTFAHLLLGAPDRLSAEAVLSERGTDLDVTVLGRYPGGVLATLSASMTSWSDRSAALATDLGHVHLEGDFHHPEAAVFVPHGPSGPGEPVRITGREPVLGAGYGNEVAEVARCVREGLRESPMVPHARTLAVLAQLDDVRRLIGVTFPARPPTPGPLLPGDPR
ncbi:Glucose--fructose oxidoreductase precursor [Nocardioides dokdonensis FR1436]|uniref:Glucose--fructose oxidoreductase n=1 Tax=Nocardioides dokdonensis FR1436 TaxID=1300347 RepID=A0A1A9GFF7_9ACTN|nr:Gfo/Idh/MocA family oxidoreductase [Nocardioides dokdonensis]ANH36984.1 Glucose--fructose oxidoreductase precursor [Nocardioides dokdonensis FR1436]